MEDNIAQISDLKGFVRYDRSFGEHCAFMPGFMQHTHTHTHIHLYVICTDVPSRIVDLRWSWKISMIRFSAARTPTVCRSVLLLAIVWQMLVVSPRRPPR